MYIHVYFSRSSFTFLFLYNPWHWPLTSIPVSLLFCFQQHRVIHSLAEALLDTTGYKIIQNYYLQEKRRLSGSGNTAMNSIIGSALSKVRSAPWLIALPPFLWSFKEFKNWPENQYNSCRSPSKRRKEKCGFSWGNYSPVSSGRTFEVPDKMQEVLLKTYSLNFLG